MDNNSKIEDVGYDFVPSSTRRLKEPISFEDFLKNKTAYFEVAKSDEAVLDLEREEDEKELQKRVIDDESVWEGEETSQDGQNPLGASPGEHLESYDVLESMMTDVIYDVDGSLLEIPGGVKKRTVQNGAGECAKRGDLVWVHYKLFLEDRDEPFDATAKHKPKRFTIGNGEVIPGLDIALIGMKEKQMDHCIFTHQYAFGPLGCPPQIPEEAKVLMYIRLVRIHVSDTEVAVEDLPYAERKQLGFDAIYDAAERKKTIGNDHQRKGENDEAIREYIQAQELASELIPIQETETSKANLLVYSIQLNLAKVYIDTAKFRKAIKHSREALSAPLPESRKVKAYYRLAKALFEAGKVEEAEEPIKKACSLCLDSSINQLYQEIKDELIKRANTERETAKKMFQNLKIK